LERARAMEGSMEVIEQVHEEFAKIFGRRYDPWVEEFMTDGADMVFFMQGGHAVTARFAIQHLRDKGIKVGLVRLRTIRPYPTDRVNEVLSKFKVVGVIETNMGLGSASSGGSQPRRATGSRRCAVSNNAWKSSSVHSPARSCGSRPH